MADRQGQREKVFCHQCGNTWNKDDHGLQCPDPDCESEFTEVIDEHQDPRDLHAAAPLLSINPVRDHYPWTEDTSDPDEGDISRVEYSSGPSGVSITRTTFRASTPLRSRAGRLNSPSPVIESFATMLQSMVGQQQRLSQRRTSPFPTGRDPSLERGYSAPTSPLQEGPGRLGIGEDSAPGIPGRFAYNSTARLWPRDANNPQPRIEPVDDLHGLLGVLFQNLNDLHPDNVENPRGGGAPPAQNPFATLFAPFLNPANAASGDAVYTQEALDRVITQLMEQHTSGNAPGPASAAAIAALPRKKMNKTLQDENGQAQCSVCIETVPIGEEVTSLPCGHWFHHDCIAMWLKEHDTCPHCRASITPKEGDANAPRAPEQAPLHSPRGPSSGVQGSRENPLRIPSESSRDSRYTHVEFRRRRSSQANSRGSGEGGSGGITSRVRNWWQGTSSGNSSGVD